MHNIKCVVKERKPLGDTNMDWDQSSWGNEAVEWTIQIQCASDDYDIPFSYFGSKCGSPTSYIKSYTDCPMRFCVENMINPIIKPSIIKEPLTCLFALQVEATFAVKVSWCILALYEASVTFRSVGIPNDAAVRWGFLEAIR